MMSYRSMVSSAHFAACSRLSIAIASALAWSLALHAQEVPAVDASAETSADDAASQGGLEDIVVTAQKRSENLQRTAIAVSAVTGDSLINAGVSDTAGLTKLVPALVVQPSVGAATNFYLRGVGSFAANAFTENPIAFNFAGVYIARPAAPAGTFYDLERVEVLKGPQGTLYGRNATGGAINVIPKRPSFDAPQADMLFEYGNYNSKKVSAAANLPISDRLALRVAGQIVDRDGYMSDGYDDENGQALRGSLLAEPVDGVSILLTGDYFHQGGQGAGAVLMPSALVPNAPSPKDRIGNSDPRSTAAFAAAFPTLVGPGLISLPQNDGFLDNEFWGVSANIDVEIGDATLTILPAYRDSRPDYLTYNAGYTGRVIEVAKQKSLEVRLTSSDAGRFKYVLGGYLFDEKQDSFNRFDQGILLQTQFATAIRNKSAAVFGQAGYELFDGFRVIGGIRYTHDEKSHDTDFLQRQFGAGNPVQFSGDVTDSSVTYKAGVEFDAAPASLLYANIATGFKSGGFFIAPLDNVFKPEKLTAVTVGSKNRFFDNKLQFNVEAFYWKYKNQQINYIGPTRVSPTQVGAGLVTTNAGQSRMYGAEVEISFKPTDNDIFMVDVQYLNSKFNEFLYFAASASGAPPRVGCSVTPSNAFTLPAPGRIFQVDCSGRSQINAPKWTANASYERTFQLNAGLNLVLGARSRVESSRYLSAEFLPEQRQKSYMMSDAYLTLESDDKQWSVTGFVNNIENKTIYGGSNLRPVTPVVYNILRPPRTYGVRVGFHF